MNKIYVHLSAMHNGSVVELFVEDIELENTPIEDFFAFNMKDIEEIGRFELELVDGRECLPPIFGKE